MKLEVAPNEVGKIRLFSLSMSNEDAQKLRIATSDQRGQKSENEVSQLLGIDALDCEHVELFPIEDLGELGLLGYLSEGHGIDSSVFNPDRIKLAALTGWIMIIHSKAFSGTTVSFELKPEVTLIGTYERPAPNWSENTTLKSNATGRQSEPQTKQVSDAAMSGRVASIALAVLFGLTALMIWIAS